MRPTLVLALTLIPLAASAQEGAGRRDTRPAQTPGADFRFQMERTNNGFVRLDRQTGAMSFCTLEGQNLRCRASEDERAALQEEIDRLAGQADGAKKQQAERGGTAESKNSVLRLPSDQELARLSNFFQDLMRKLMGVVRGLDPSSAGRV